MRLLPWLTLAISLTLMAPAEARLFWHTYGSTIPSEDGCGCTWNWNQDYFVPRHPTSCRYGMYSDCKVSRSTSSACRYSHPFYAGYCNIYGPCHYRRRNHVYSAYCGCSPLQICPSNGYGTSVSTGCCVAGNGCDSGCYEPEAPLYNVESSQLDILGSIPVEGGDLLTRTDFSQLGNDGGGRLLLQQQGTMPQLPGLPTTSGVLPSQTLPTP